MFIPKSLGMLRPIQITYTNSNFDVFSCGVVFMQCYMQKPKGDINYSIVLSQKGIYFWPCSLAFTVHLHLCISVYKLCSVVLHECQRELATTDGFNGAWPHFWMARVGGCV